MQFDMGIYGLGILVSCALIFGVAAQALLWRQTHWAFLLAAIGWFVGGFIASEVIWGTLTEAEIQPIIDGLAVDESLLGGLIGGLIGVGVAWFLRGGTGYQRPVTM